MEIGRISMEGRETKTQKWDQHTRSDKRREEKVKNLAKGSKGRKRGRRSEVRGARKSKDEQGRASKSEEGRARARKSMQERGRQERARARKSEEERAKLSKPRIWLKFDFWATIGVLRWMCLSLARSCLKQLRIAHADSSSEFIRTLSVMWALATRASLPRAHLSCAINFSPCVRTMEVELNASENQINNRSCTTLPKFNYLMSIFVTLGKLKARNFRISTQLRRMLFMSPVGVCNPIKICGSPSLKYVSK